MSNQDRNAAQLFYDAFKKDANVAIEESYEDIILFRKGKMFYVGDDRDYFVGGFPENLAREYFEDRKMQRIVDIALDNPGMLEEMIQQDAAELAMEAASEEYRTNAFTARNA